MIFLSHSAERLFHRFLFAFLGEALRFFAASFAFLDVISAVTVSHKLQHSFRLRHFPSCFVLDAGGAVAAVANSGPEFFHEFQISRSL
jgi:hypothetical protein